MLINVGKWFDNLAEVNTDLIESINLYVNEESNQFVLVMISGKDYFSKNYTTTRDLEFAINEFKKRIDGEI